MKVKLLKKLRKRFMVYDKTTHVGFSTYKQWTLLDINHDKEYDVGTMQGGLHLATFLSGYQDRDFKSKPWKDNFQILKRLING